MQLVNIQAGSTAHPLSTHFPTPFGVCPPDPVDDSIWPHVGITCTCQGRFEEPSGAGVVQTQSPLCLLDPCHRVWYRDPLARIPQLPLLQVGTPASSSRSPPA